MNNVNQVEPGAWIAPFTVGLLVGIVLVPFIQNQSARKLRPSQRPSLEELDGRVEALKKHYWMRIRTAEVELERAIVLNSRNPGAQSAATVAQARLQLERVDESRIRGTEYRAAQELNGTPVPWSIRELEDMNGKEREYVLKELQKELDAKLFDALKSHFD